MQIICLPYLSLPENKPAAMLTRSQNTKFPNYSHSMSRSILRCHLDDDDAVSLVAARSFSRSFSLLIIPKYNMWSRLWEISLGQKFFATKVLSTSARGIRATYHKCLRFLSCAQDWFFATSLLMWSPTALRLTMRERPYSVILTLSSVSGRSRIRLRLCLTSRMRSYFTWDKDRMNGKVP